MIMLYRMNKRKSGLKNTQDQIKGGSEVFLVHHKGDSSFQKEGKSEFPL